jgi:hypothetical protein
MTVTFMWHACGTLSGPIATSDETLLWLLEKSKRQGAVPVHKVFVQQGRDRWVTPGPLSQFVRSGRERALDLYLLAITCATRKPYHVARAAGVWARALSIGSTKTAASSISKQWRWLEEQNLIRRTGRSGRYAELEILREDGSGAHFLPGERGGPWFNVPFAYWEENWYGRLDLPAKAVLLISLSLMDDFYLPQEKAPAWYGLSPDTAGRGLRTLKDYGLLTQRVLQKPATAAPTGFTRQHYYTLSPPFGPKGKRSRTLSRAQVVPP